MDLNIFHALFETLLKNPASLVILLAIGIAAFVLEKWQTFPSKLILAVSVFLGMILFPVLSPWDKSLDIYPYPQAIQSLNGLILGFVAWIVHAALIRRVIKKFNINGAGDTDFFKKPDVKDEPPKS